MDHDLSYRDIFAFFRMARSALVLWLPKLAATLDLDTLVRADSVFVSETGQRRQTDIVWRARLKADPSAVVGAADGRRW